MTESGMAFADIASPHTEPVLMTTIASAVSQSTSPPRDEAFESFSREYEDQSTYSTVIPTASEPPSPLLEKSSKASLARGRSPGSKCVNRSCSHHKDSSAAQNPKLKARREHEPSPSLDREVRSVRQPEPRKGIPGPFELETDDVPEPAKDHGSRVNTSYIFPSQWDQSSYTRPNPGYQAGWGSQPGLSAPYTPAPAHQHYSGQEYQLPPSPLPSPSISPVRAYHTIPVSPPISPAGSRHDSPQPFPSPLPQYPPPHPSINNPQAYEASPLGRSYTTRPTSPLFNQSHIGTINGQPCPPSQLPISPIHRVHSETIEFSPHDRPCDLRARRRSRSCASGQRDSGHGESESKPGQAKSILKSSSQQQGRKHAKKQEAKQENQGHSAHAGNSHPQSNQRRRSRHPPGLQSHETGVQQLHPAHETWAAFHLTDFQQYVAYVIEDGDRQDPEWGLARAAMNLVTNYKLGDEAERNAITSAWNKRKYTSVAEKGLGMLKRMGWYWG